MSVSNVHHHFYACSIGQNLVNMATFMQEKLGVNVYLSVQEEKMASVIKQQSLA